MPPRIWVFTWLAMLFTAAMAAAVLYFIVSDILHYDSATIEHTAVLLAGFLMMSCVAINFTAKK